MATKRASLAPAAPAMRTGIYLDYGRHSAIVVRVKDGTAMYLSMATGKVSLCQSSIERFLHDFIIAMPNYPVLKAAKIYYYSGLEIEEAAERVLKLLFANAVNRG